MAGNSIDSSLAWTNILPFVPLVRAVSHDMDYAVGTTSAELSKAALLVPFFNAVKGGVLKAIEYRDIEKERNIRRQEGKEELTSQALGVIDLTNQPGRGNHEGDLVDALRKNKRLHPEKWETIEKVFGPMCEIVREDVPRPAYIPDNLYLRLKTQGYRDPDTLKKRGAKWFTAMILDAIDQDHTAFDTDPDAIRKVDDAIPRLIGACDNVEAIKGEDGGPIQIPKFAIVNDRDQNQHEAIGKAGVISQPGKLADLFPKYQDYDTIIVEQVVTKYVINELRGKKVAFFFPAEGKAIAENFRVYAERYINDNKINNPPEFISIDSSKIEDGLAKQTPDIILVIGENDPGVMRTVENIIQFQAKNIETRVEDKRVDYPSCPVLTFLEGHSADSTVKRLRDFIASDAVTKNDLQLSTVYLHDLLANEVGERLYKKAKLLSKKD